MNAYSQESYDEKIAETAERYEDVIEDFGRWCLTPDGLEAFDDFRQEVLAPSGLDTLAANDLDPERFKLFFEHVISQSELLDHWVGYYRSKWPDTFKEFNTPDE